ncbi:MAG TPA: HlyD family efflux transporter periplasmic adaptor subunit [Gammaproteobacteria bacterium]
MAWPSAHASVRGQRLEDGSILLPKPAQFRLGIRTQLPSRSEAGRSIALSGTVIADPQRRDIVSVTESSLLEAPPTGFPVVGSVVAAGQTLGFARPVLSSLEQARRRAALAGVEQALAVNEQSQQLLRQQLHGQVAMASAGSTVERLEAERHALRVRTQELQASLESRIPIKAPQAGTISRVHARIGALIKPGDVVFEIVDPGRLWVEAAHYAPQPVAAGGRISAITERDTRLTLDWVGQDVQLREEILKLNFRVVGADAPVRIGEPVNLRIESAVTERGLQLPASSRVWTAGGGDFVWVQTQAERFAPRPVQTISLGDDRILVTAGLQPDERVVVAGAWLLDQIKY